MPPKRKIKVSKTVSHTSFKTPAGNRASAVSNKRRASHSLQGSKMSRLTPSIPFQMTTRRGAKTTSNHTSPVGPSSASSGSRRSSLNGIAQYENAPSDLEDEDEQPAKRSRTSTDSGSPQVSNASFDNNSNTPMNGTQTPELQRPASGAIPTASRIAGKRRRASDDSSQSSKTLGPRQNGVLTRTQSDISEQQPRRKKRKTTETPADTADQPPELTDASTAPNSPEQIPDVDGSQGLQNVLPTNGDAPAKSGRRLPGRRRQPHPDINVETDLRRQLNLKMSYRSLAKVQKALLEELSNRTTNNLEADENYHTQCPEYEPLMASLDQRRDSRLDEVNAIRTYRLDQLERVRVAEERIQKEQYINRFQELQDDFLLQCYFRMKQIEREMKGDETDATDDEDNVLPPTYTDEPYHDADDRIGSKFASRSRAYVEADRELENDSRRARFNQARAAFVEKDNDADDSIKEVSGGFARFTGPDRTEAILHHNMTSLADAAIEVERTPSPQLEAPHIQIIPNEHASLLMMLAELSAQRITTDKMQEPQYQDQQSPQPAPPPSNRAITPVIKQELTKQMSPVFAPSGVPVIMPSHATHSSPVKASQPAVDLTQGVSCSEPTGIATMKEVDAPKHTTPARVSTHRIMDILNDDQEVPVSRLRESQPPIQEPTSPSRREVADHHNTDFQSGAHRLDAIVDRQEPPVDQALMDALGEPSHAPNNPPSSPPSNTQSWPRSSVGPSSESEDALRRRDPLRKLRELLDRKAREHGREPPDRSQADYWQRPEYGRYLSSLPSAQQRADIAGYDPNRPSAGLYSASPIAAPAYPEAARRGSQDQSAPHWERDRRMSASQAPQQTAASPYQESAPQLYQKEHNNLAPTPPTHQSPYAPPPGSLPLPPKPPGPPPSGPINFRFAHYDPAPPRQSYPPPSPTYPQGPQGSHGPLGPPPPQYSTPYGGTPVYQGGYVPPPGSFQAPPPPPSSMPPYPPLKIHQYGGQPILPANMAPPPPSGPPMTFVGQSAPPPAFSSTQSQPLGPSYEQRESQGERPPEPQSRPRRQYRSYHAPGTQFRSYQGPGENRRRGG
ncbi:Nn.00g078060.m01.CDS01 [Neocucurbitaria sp. VM-36]